MWRDPNCAIHSLPHTSTHVAPNSLLADTIPDFTAVPVNSSTIHLHLAATQFTIPIRESTRSVVNTYENATLVLALVAENEYLPPTHVRLPATVNAQTRLLTSIGQL